MVHLFINRVHLFNIDPRHELDGVVIKGEPVVFPPKKESIPYRYKLFLEMYGEDTSEVWKKAYSKTWKRAKALRVK